VKLSRRTLLRSGAAALATPVVSSLSAFAQSAGDKQWRHGLSLFGDLKYPAGFKHFDYVNPAAPKAGAVRMGMSGTFDNFNVVIRGVKGSIAAGIDSIYQRLITPAFDEVSGEYGLLAEAVSHPADFSSVIYRLRPDARWHDGKPITTDDVIFSFEAYKKHHPAVFRLLPARHQGRDDRRARDHVHVRRAGNRELPQIVGQFAVLPKHWWEARRLRQEARRFGDHAGNPAWQRRLSHQGVCRGPHRGARSASRTIGPRISTSASGRDNFEEVRYEYFRDTIVAREAFKGDTLDWRTENSAKDWATAYDFPAVKENRVLLEEFEIRSQGVMQAFVFNIRRDKFKDPRCGSR
jgi:microcin C transport system substrate-binding protein